MQHTDADEDRGQNLLVPPPRIMTELTEMKHKHTRRRLNPTIRWTEAQTKQLLQCVLEEVGIHPGRFEKPTAQIFYATVCEKAPEVRPIKWQIIKNKMRNLKTSFLTTAAWQTQTGAKLLADGNEFLYRDHMERCCPYFDALERLFGHLLTSRNSSEITATSSDLDEYADDLMTSDILSTELESMSSSNVQGEQSPDDVQIKVEVTEPVVESDNEKMNHMYHSEPVIEPVDDHVVNHAPLGYTPEPSTASNSETDYRAKSVYGDKQPWKRPAPETSSVFQLVVMQEKKLKFEVMKLQQQLDLERQKLDLEREKLCLSREQKNVDIEMKRLQLEQDMEIKKLEMERDERLALTKMRLEVESQERIKKYELELKVKIE